MKFQRWTIQFAGITTNKLVQQADHYRYEEKDISMAEHKITACRADGFTQFDCA